MVLLRLPAFLSPQTLRHEALILRSLRVALVLCMLLIPLFGFMLDRAMPDGFDPWEIRVAWTVICLGALVATFTSGWVRARAPHLLSLLLTGVLVWIGALTALNGLASEIALGFLFTYVGVGVMLGLASERILTHLALGLGIAIAVAVATPDPETDPGIFLLSAAATGIVLYIGTYARIRDRGELEARTQLLATAERLGDLGSWSLDLSTGHRRWSDGMYRLVGVPPHEGDPPTVSSFTRPDQRSEIATRERQLRKGEVDAVDHRFEIVRPGGAVCEVRSIVQLIRSDDGTPRRLAGVVVDVTAQAEHEAELEAARQTAEEAAALKSAILANMSHEIRTPLTAVIGYAQILRDEVPADLHDLVVPIETGGHRLMETLNAVLDYAQLEAGRATLAREVVDAAALAAEIAEAAHERATTEGLALTFTRPEAPILVTADHDALHRALTHLVSNAIKFTPAGSIRIQVDVDRHEAVLQVADTGQGIAPEFMSRLFEAFRQQSTGTARTHEGSGLGLAVTHRLVVAMGGTIEAESALDVGTTFTIRLPLATIERDDEPPPEGTAWIARGTPSAVAARLSEPAPADA